MGSGMTRLRVRPCRDDHAQPCQPDEGDGTESLSFYQAGFVMLRDAIRELRRQTDIGAYA
jgi:hypothetical protein